MDQRFDIGALVRSAAAATADGPRLRALTRRCWPAAAETTQPAARAWVRRWRPQLIVAPEPQCTCATGACGWCN